MTPQDREEHRLAAMAAGIDADYVDGGFDRFYRVNDKVVRIRDWRPKTDKADSFDLMVACGISVDSHIDGYAVFSSWREGVEDINVQPEDAFTESYMKAVFDMAVEIGRDKEGKE